MKRTLVIGFLCMTLAACNLFEADVIQVPVDAGPQPIALIPPGGEGRLKLIVEIADDEDERQQGLMGRESLPEGSGMLFLFPEPEILTFWMKNTKIPLDIIFFSNTGKWVSQGSMLPCFEDPCTRYTSGEEAQIALEVAGGTIDKYKIGPGWQLGLPR